MTTKTRRSLLDKPRSDSRQKELPAVAKFKELNETTQVAERIREIARGYRIRFGGLGQSRVLSDNDKAAIVHTDAALEQLSVVKKLYSKHPAMTAVAAAKSKVRSFFEANTLPFPEPGVRLFLLKTDHLDLAEISEEEATKDFARQMEQFEEQFQEQLRVFGSTVASLQDVWENVVAAAQVKLGSRFNASDYPQREQLPDRLKIQLDPFNIAIPTEYNYASPVARERAMQAVRAQFQEAIRMQEVVVVTMLHEALDGMVASVKGYSTGVQQSFKASVVERVFGALQEFQEKTVKYGILSGTALQTVFAKVNSIVTAGGIGAETLPKLLRNSSGLRSNMIEKLTEVKAELVVAAGERLRPSARRIDLTCE